jgi:drug/metabolite transporter (DMT)-like permease
MDHNTIGVLIALASSCLGGSAAAVTRYLVGNADPLTLALLRWGIGFLVVLPVTLLLRSKMPPRAACRLGSWHLLFRTVFRIL